MSNKEESVQIRTSQKQNQLIEQLSRIPIVEVASQKIGIGRNNYYRWRRQSTKFASACDKAIEEGCQFINELAESQLISAMKDGNLTSCMYWLNHRSPAYSNKLELSGSVTSKSEKLTPEQETSIKKALKLMMLTGSLPNGKEGQNANSKND